MAVPEGAKKTLQEADEAMKELEKMQNTPEGALPENQEPVADEGEEKEKEKEEEAEQAEQTPEPQKEEEQEGEAIPPAIQARLDELAKQLQTSEAARKVLEGKYNAEVRDALRENATLRELLRQRDEQRPAPSSTKEPTIEDELLKDEDVKYVHDEHPEIYKTMLKAMEAMKKSVAVTPDMSSKQDIEALKAAIAKQETNNFWQVLNKEVPDWNTIRDMPEFTLFLNETEDFSGKTFNELAMEAVNASTYDGERSGTRLARIYNAFKSKHAPSTPKNVEVAPEAEPQPKKQISLPNRGRPAIPKGDAETITENQILEHYRRIQSGYYKNKPEELKKMEAMIDAALKKSVGVPA